MPSDKEFDNILKNKFEGFEAPLPDGGWNKIKDRIPRKKRRPVLLPLMAAASVFFAILSGYLFLKQKDMEASMKAKAEQQANTIALSSTAPDSQQQNSDAQISESTSAAPESTQNTTSSDSPSSENEVLATDDNGSVAQNSTNAVESTESTQPEENEAQVVVPVVALPTNTENITEEATSSSTITEHGEQLVHPVLPVVTDEAIIAAVAADNENGTTASVTNMANGNNETAVLNAANNGISKALFRQIALLESDGRELALVAVPVAAVDNLIEIEEQDDEEENTSKWHFGIGPSLFITSKLQQGNENDDQLVTSFQKPNAFNKERVGVGADAVVAYDLSDRLQVIGVVDYNRFTDKSSYTVMQENSSPVITQQDNQSFNFSNYTPVEVEQNTTLNYVGMQSGLRYYIGPVKTSYITAKGGASLLAGASEKGNAGDMTFRNLNYSAALSLGKEYDLNGQYKLNVEPEASFFLMPYANGAVQSTPYMLGLNLILMR